MDRHYLVKGDTGSQLKVIIKREDTGDVVNCANGTVRLYFRKKYETSVLFTLTAEANNELLVDGIAIFSFESNLNSLDPGYYTGEVEVTFSDSSIETVYETISFTLRDDF